MPPDQSSCLPCHDVIAPRPCCVTRDEQPLPPLLRTKSVSAALMISQALFSYLLLKFKNQSRLPPQSNLPFRCIQPPMSMIKPEGLTSVESQELCQIATPNSVPKNRNVHSDPRSLHSNDVPPLDSTPERPSRRRKTERPPLLFYTKPSYPSKHTLAVAMAMALALILTIVSSSYARFSSF
ncbi:hypothetical protein ACLB2K_024313 [Fragaria x ananassa]